MGGRRIACQGERWWRSRRRWRQQFRRHMGRRRHGHAVRQQHREVCHLARKGFGRVELRVGQPQWRDADRRIRSGFELDRFGAFFGSHRRRDTRTIRWLHRTLECVQTIEKTPVFASLDDFKSSLCISPNYTPSAPKLRLIATPVSDQIKCVKRRVSLRCVTGDTECRTVP